MITGEWATEQELCVESQKILSKLDVVSIALKQVEDSNLAVRCSTVIDEIFNEMDAFDRALQNGIKTEEKIKELQELYP